MNDGDSSQGRRESFQEPALRRHEIDDHRSLPQLSTATSAPDISSSVFHSSSPRLCWRLHSNRILHQDPDEHLFRRRVNDLGTQPGILLRLLRRII
jgi:hypothetical protein